MSQVMNSKLGANIIIGDSINVGIIKRIGAITGFIKHEISCEITGRVAVTNQGNITIIDTQLVEVF
jgi:hypothetical protein